LAELIDVDIGVGKSRLARAPCQDRDEAKGLLDDGSRHGGMTLGDHVVIVFPIAAMGPDSGPKRLTPGLSIGFGRTVVCVVVGVDLSWPQLIALL
jgi:hypothetical protein